MTRGSPACLGSHLENIAVDFPIGFYVIGNELLAIGGGTLGEGAIGHQFLGKLTLPCQLLQDFYACAGNFVTERGEMVFDLLGRVEIESDKDFLSGFLALYRFDMTILI